MRVVGRLVRNLAAGSTRERGPRLTPRAMSKSPTFSIRIETRSPLGQPPVFDLELASQVVWIAEPEARHVNASCEPASVSLGASVSVSVVLDDRDVCLFAPSLTYRRERRRRPRRDFRAITLLLFRVGSFFWRSTHHAPNRVRSSAATCSRSIVKSGDLDCKSTAHCMPAPETP
jgi:hypothetical protein